MCRSRLGCPAVIIASSLANKPELKERYAARAVAPLKQAVEKGYNDAAHIKKAPDLDALRDRTDFKALLKELEGRKP